jgi:hypothetical protein
MTTGDSLCKYKHVFGKEKEGVHSIRVFNIAVVDVVFSLLGAWCISYATGVPLAWCVIGVFVTGVVAHRLFCVNTTINTYIFGRV